jgi:hypothetical protein
MSSLIAIWPENLTTELNPGNEAPFAVIRCGDGTTIHLETVADADALILAAVAAKDLLLSARVAEPAPVGAP